METCSKLVKQLNSWIKVVENRAAQNRQKSGLYFHKGIGRCWTYWENLEREVIVMYVTDHAESLPNTKLTILSRSLSRDTGGP